MAAETRQAILDAAEYLFARRGFDGVSLRQITWRAGVNLAAVNYHFRSKETLIKTVISRRVIPIMEERLRLLEQYKAQARGKPVPLEKILDAFIRPILTTAEARDSACAFAPLLGRMFSEPRQRQEQFFNEHLHGLAVRFHDALREALPRLPVEDLLWRLHLILGGTAHMLAGREIIRSSTRGRCDPSKVDRALPQMIAFWRAGLRAPAVTAGSHRQVSKGGRRGK